MSEPIISPWLIYLADVCDCLSMFFSTIAILLGGVTIAYGVGLIESYGIEGIHDIHPLFKKAVCAFVIALTVATFVPSKDTIISMAVANVVTRENINLTKNEILSLITDVKNILDGNKCKKQ